jgi:hypothetical protein
LAAEYAQAKADNAMSRAGAAVAYVAETPGRLYGQASNWAREQLLAAQADLAQAYQVTIDAGLEGAGKIVSEMSQRVGGALANLGAGAGAAFESFMGFKPKEGYEALWYLALAALGVVAIAAFSPAGSAIGSGIGRAYAGVGEGVGSGIKGLLSNPDKLLTGLLKVIP